MSDRITLEELQAALTAADPAALLVAPRYLRRIIRLDRELPGLGLHVPHRKSYVIDRARARQMVRPDEAPELHQARVPPTVLLLAAPEPRRLARLSKSEVLLRFSRRLFHGRIDFHFKTQWLPAHDRVAVRQRIDDIGQAAFDEIRAVLRDENYLLPPFDDPQVYAEFCAVFFELERYAPSLLPQYFPTLPSSQAVAALLRRDVPADELFEQTKLPGMVLPTEVNGRPHDEPARPKAFNPWNAASLQRTGAKPLRFRFHRLRAHRAARRGNDVRCVLQNAAAYRVAPSRFADEARQAADEALGRLARRLARGIHLAERSAEDLERLLPTLLPAAVGGFWNESAKLLYDLQSACVDLEREHYAVDAWAWLFSLGRTPLRRPLPALPEVLAARRLRSAARRLGRIAMPPPLREEWLQVVRTASHAADQVVRERFGPVLAETLRAHGFAPATAVDRIAFDKMAGELLDVAVARGRFSLGDLRDLVARNDLKLPDVHGFADFWSGGAILRTDRALARAFDGVYRAGEFYLRWLLQFTSLAYGTRTGRFITRHFALPIGGAILVVEGLQHTLFVLIRLAFHLPYNVPFANRWTIAIAAGIIYACVHSEEFRARLWGVVKWVGRGLKRVFIDWPARFLRWPSIQKFLHSPWFVLLRRAILFPLAAAYGVIELTPALVNTFLEAFLPDRLIALSMPRPPIEYLPTAFAVAAAVFISPLGRSLEEFIVDRLLWTWRRVRFDLLPGLVRVVMEFFRLLLDGLERLLYAVDERLRFHAGDSRWSLVVKAVVGALWAVVENVVRAVVTLTIEPQVNPVKHFPVVTVSHKILIPMAPDVVRLMTPVMGTEYAVLTSGVLLSGLAGVCGFLAWELLTNWRLYEATRPDTLRPRAFGSHGETMVRMLRPGFHSGTVPKLFARLRRARRAELRGGSPIRVERLHDELHHAAEAVEQFVHRELLRALAERPVWQGTPCSADRVTLASNRIVVAVDCPSLGEGPFKFAFEEQSGWLAAGVVDEGWLAATSPEQRNAVEWALAGFYKRCGVQVVREQLEAVLNDLVPDVDAYDIADDGLVVWRNDPRAGEVTYDLWSETDPVPPSPPEAAAIAAPLPLRAALFSAAPLTWVRWAYYWNTTTEGGPLPWKLLPTPARRGAKTAAAAK